MTQYIPLDELPARMRMLAAQMQEVGDAIAYFGGFGAFGDYGRMLSDQSAPICRDIATAMESLQGGGRA